MGSRRKLPVVALLGTALLVGGCKSAYQKSVDKADRAEREGDWFLAAKHYRKACKEKPESEACDKASDALERGVDESMKDATRAIDRGRILAAAEPLEEASKNAPSHKKVTAFTSRWVAAALKSCEPSGAAPHRLVALARSTACVSRMGSAVPSSEHVARSTQKRLNALANEVDALQFPDESALLETSRTLAACVAPTPEREMKRTQAKWAAWLKHAVDVDVTMRTGWSTPDGQAVCHVVSEPLLGMVRCKPGRGVRVEMHVNASPVRHEQSEEERVARYVVGTQTVPNPQYAQVRDELYLAERAFRDVEPETRQREARCRAGSQFWCDQYNAMVPVYNERQRTLDDAQRKFHNTPATLQENVYRDHHYIVQHHTWRSEASADVAVAGGARVTKSKDMGRTDSAQTGFEPAGVQTDPLQAPSEQDFRVEAVQLAVDAAREQLGNELRNRAREQLEACLQRAGGDGAAALECHAIHLRQSGQPLLADPDTMVVPAFLDVGRKIACAKPDDVRKAGVGLAKAGFPWSRQAGFPSAGGALVSQANGEGDAAASGVRVNDVVVAVGGAPVTDTIDAARLLRTHRALHLEPAITLVRDGKRQQLTLRYAPRARDEDEESEDSDEEAVADTSGAGLDTAPVMKGSRLAVLEFTSESASDVEARMLLSDAARGAAVSRLGPRGVDVMTRESVATIVAEMKTCEGDCELETGRSIGARWVVTGSISRVENAYFVTLKLFDVTDGSVMAVRRVSRAKLAELPQAVEDETVAMLDSAFVLM